MTFEEGRSRVDAHDCGVGRDFVGHHRSGAEPRPGADEHPFPTTAWHRIGEPSPTKLTPLVGGPSSPITLVSPMTTSLLGSINSRCPTTAPGWMVMPVAFAEVVVPCLAGSAAIARALARTLGRADSAIVMAIPSKTTTWDSSPLADLHMAAIGH